MKVLIRRTATGLAALLIAGGAFAADTVAHVDSSFMKSAAEAGMFEVAAGQLAVSKATNAQVKGFGQQMIDDHTKAGDELKTLAASKGVTLPTEPSLTQRAKLKLLETDSGPAFDKRYADTFAVSAHKDTVALFQKESKNGKDADLKAWVDKTLPTLQHHYDMAKDVKTQADAEKK